MNYAPRAIPSSASQADVKTRARFIMRTYGHLLAAILAFASLEVFFFTSGLARPIAGLLLTSGMGWLLVLGGFVVLGALFSGIAVAIAESSDTNVRDVSDLPILGDAPVLAAIPMINNARDRRMRRLRVMSWTAAYCVAVSFVTIVVIHAVN